ncbi:hypothetical protein [Ligilactobacillus agilis]|uniref:hypothetical protein n=1 Tax=Ligilactobacillus agilis TaxID=1601 RepID=UPI000B8D6F23|nr:hypothetical protein [Ligilactobacillus agilis]ASR40069.1 hypothetical protein BEN83_00370 [Ligilactobacillus agilis]
MVFVFLGLAGIAGTIFSIAFIVWIVALIINKKDLIKRAWKFTWISFAVTLVCSLGYGFTLWGVFDSSNDTEQVSQSETKEDKEDDKYAEQQENEREQEEAVYTKNAPKKVTFEKDDYDGAGVLTKYNMRNGYKYNYYKDSDGDYFYYSINDKDTFPPDRRYLHDELATIATNEKYAKTHKKDMVWDDDPNGLSKLKESGVYTMNPPQRDKVNGGILSKNFNRQKGYQVNYYYGTFKTPNNVKDPISSDSKQYADGYYYYDSDGYSTSVNGDYIKTAEDKLKNNPDDLLQQ